MQLPYKLTTPQIIDKLMSAGEHSMPHHSQNVIGLPLVKILEQHRKSLEKVESTAHHATNMKRIHTAINDIEEGLEWIKSEYDLSPPKTPPP